MTYCVIKSKFEPRSRKEHKVFKGFLGGLSAFAVRSLFSGLSGLGILRDIVLNLLQDLGDLSGNALETPILENATVCRRMQLPGLWRI
jgi:hypothetical protein